MLEVVILQFATQSLYKQTEVVVGVHTTGLFAFWCKSGLSTTPTLQSMCSLQMTFEVLLLFLETVTSSHC